MEMQTVRGQNDCSSTWRVTRTWFWVCKKNPRTSDKPHVWDFYLCTEIHPVTEKRKSSNRAGVELYQPLRRKITLSQLKPGHQTTRYIFNRKRQSTDVPSWMSRVECSQKEKVKWDEVTITNKSPLFQQWLKRHSLPHRGKVLWMQPLQFYAAQE